MRNTRVLVVAALTLGVCALAPAARAAEGEEAEPREREGARGEEEANRAIQRLLKEKQVSFEFVDTPLRDALKFLRQALNVNLVVAPEVDDDVPLTLRVKNMQAGAALQWMLKIANARMEVKDGAIYVQPGGGRGDEEPGEKARAKLAALRAEAEARRLKAAKALRYRRPLGKAVLHLGEGITVELNLYEDDLGPETRDMLRELLHLSVAQRLGEVGRRLEELERREREREEERERRELERRRREMREQEEREREEREREEPREREGRL
ncbi:MAG: hypothetical protein ACLF0G_07035 [Candidatus Brocadiia bacterium]